MLTEVMELAPAVVRNWMTPHPYTCTAETTLADAHDMMEEYGCRRLPVVDENGKLIGIVTRSDLQQSAPSRITSLSLFELNYLWAKLTVGEVMTPDPVTVAPTDTIKTACERMLQHKVSGLPVVVEGKVVGVLTETDILRLLVSLP
jgi:acetoin utilization protein AcuB